MEESVQQTTGGYNKRPLWQWVVIYAVIGLIVYGAIYYFILSRNKDNYSKSSKQYSSPSPSQKNPSTSVATNKETTLVLKPVKNSNEAGSATLIEEKGQTKVIVNLTGFTKDIEQPVHIHVGKCPGVGSVKYPLTSVVNGTSETLLSVTLESLKKELPLAINVHKSQTEVSTYTACGHLIIK